jgi:hypothetical protein
VRAQVRVQGWWLLEMLRLVLLLFRLLAMVQV